MPAPFAPVTPEDLVRLRELGMARDSLAHKVLSLELEKIPLLGAGRRIDEEHDAVLSRIMAERGISPLADVNINPKTGEIIVVSDSEEVEPRPQAVSAQPS